MPPYMLSITLLLILPTLPAAFLQTASGSTSAGSCVQSNDIAQALSKLQATLEGTDAYVRVLGQKLHEVQKHVFVLQAEQKSKDRNNEERLKTVQAGLASLQANVGIMKNNTDKPDYTYKGCFKNSHLDLNDNDERVSRNDMNVDMCHEICKAKETRYFSVQNGHACFCGDRYGRFGPSDGCNVVCRGNPNQICGASCIGSVYEIIA